MTSWGLSATVKAPRKDILTFAAYHLEHGAAHLFLYLDDPDSAAFPALDAHPRITCIRCDDAWWQGKRPKKHQVRQSRNATDAYTRAQHVDWLIHMDVDEFLVSGDVGAVLSALPPDQKLARIRPMEQLAGPGDHFKAFIPPGPDRNRIVAALYPTYGDALKGGFLSHLAGKLFLRTGLPGIRVQIHNAFQDDVQLEGPESTVGIDLAHCHAPTWDRWRALYDFRLQKGSYRADLAPTRPRDRGGQTLHAFFATLQARGGEAALRAFFDEVCADSPALRRRLAEFGLLRRANLGLNTTLDVHFPA